MHSPTTCLRRILPLIILLSLFLLAPVQSRGQHVMAQQRPARITILDQNGRPAPNAQPSATGQIFDVTVGPGLAFDPNMVSISAGDTVRWTWAGPGHSVTSGTPCTADLQYCSPDDMNCGAGILSGTGTVYQHTFAQPGTYSYFCSSHCSFGMTGTVNVAPAALQVTAAVSRKTHGAAGAFDINLPPTGTPGIECRIGGGTNDFTMVVTFSTNVSVTGTPQAQVILGTGCVGTGGVCNGGAVSVSGAVVTVPLTNVTDDQTINVRINGVNSVADVPATDFVIPMTRNLGDTNGTGTVTSADVAQTKSRIGQTVDGTTFRSDVNASGGINSSDVTIVKQNIP